MAQLASPSQAATTLAWELPCAAPALPVSAGNRAHLGLGRIVALYYQHGGLCGGIRERIAMRQRKAGWA
jgi:hypothetical protein